MIEINLLSIWIPIILSIVLFFIAMGSGIGDYSDIFIMPATVFLIMVIWLIWFILKEIF